MKVLAVHLSTTFYLSIYGLLSLSSLMLAFAEGTALPAGLTVVFAIPAFFLTERWRVFWLSPFWTNLLGLAALALSAEEFFGNNLEAKLLAGAHLLVYLSWIVMLQPKNSRQFWWMCGLSILQVAVGSVLTHEGLYGVMLLGFVVVTVWTLSVFSLYQSQQRFAGVEDTAVRISAGENANSHDRRQQRDDGFSLLQPSRAWRGVALNPHERWVNVRFASGILAIAAAALMIAAVFYLFIPRLWIGPRNVHAQTSNQDSAIGGGRTLTGFTEEVRLGDFGEILESTEKVLQIRLLDSQNGDRISVPEFAHGLGYSAPLFRGTVLGHYEDGHWRSGSRSRGMRLGAYRRLRSGGTPASVRQEIRLQPIGTEKLFAIHPVVGCRLESATDDVGIHSITSVMIRAEGPTEEEPLHYSVYSPNPSDWNRQPPERAALPPFIREPALQHYRSLPDGKLQRLRGLAREVAGVSSQEDPPPRTMARRLESFLRDSGRFAYSLNTSIQDPSIDPVEDFLFNRKEGHCEYFASALALMLRAVEIPSRVVNGFKGGQVNQLTGYFEVEQRHAHAWVEAYLDGRWMVFDPTPTAARNQSVEKMAGRLTTWRDVKSLVAESWSRYVVNMNLRQQRNDLYRPLKRTVQDWWETTKADPGSLVTKLAAVKNLLASPDRWFSWQGGVATFLILLLGSGSVFVLRRLIRFLRRLRGGWNIEHRRRQQHVEFFQRFQAICAARGLRRSDSQTQREFTEEAAGSLQPILASAGLKELPADVVQHFYQVRFGNVPIDEPTRSRIEEQLGRLESYLSNGREKSKRRTST